MDSFVASVALDLPAAEMLARMATIATQIDRVPAGAVSDWGSRAARAMLLPDEQSACTVSLLRPKPMGWCAFHAGAAIMPEHREAELELLCEASARQIRDWNGTHRTLLDGVPMTPGVTVDRDRPAHCPGGFAALDRLTWGIERGVSGHVVESLRRCGPSVALHVAVWRDTPWMPIEVACIEHASMMLEPLVLVLDEDGRRGTWLSHRETEVLDRLAEGLTEAEIAAALNRSPFTVHDHVKALYRKLGVVGRADLVHIALGSFPTPALSSAGASTDVSQTAFQETKPPATSPEPRARPRGTLSRMRAESRAAC